ncbi:MAG: hypothetical protein D6689_17455 [Deltaproteobacteria bacterium]|nr:MAG: hypothetical protein D6689_17455 [Deltaproteobacteria bacterium]
MQAPAITDLLAHVSPAADAREIRRRRRPGARAGGDGLCWPGAGGPRAAPPAERERQRPARGAAS